ncbi:sialate O-acetylesterase [Ruminococcaceae bacterium YRB3002]|nr:sialate O-acetylesterase [Ruminococcaceae bacterium YRB3002]
MRVKLNGIFKDNMVFQWGTEVRIFGSCTEACVVCIQMFLGDQMVDQVQIHPDDDLHFFACLPPTSEPGGPYEFRVMSFAEGDSDWQAEKLITGCYAGEVWLAAGQSNMEYPFIRSEFAKYSIEKVPVTDIHFYEVPQAGFMDEAQAKAEEESGWVIVDSGTCRNMSGIAFFFARKLEARISCKIGIIGCYVGATSISCWLSVDKLMSTYEGRRFKRDFDNKAGILSDEEYDEAFAYYEEQMRQYHARENALLRIDPFMTYSAMTETIGPAPVKPPVGRKAMRHPGAMFECMVKRVAPFALRGVIYYQGESDCEEHASMYGQVFASLIAEWRSVFYNADLPFVFCQLPMYISKERKFMNYDDYSWAKLREQQQIVAIDVPNTYMAVLADCGEFDNVHPADKKTPGNRVAAMALKYVYGFKDVPALAPYIIDARRGDGVEISFGGDFLMLNLSTGFDSDETGFEIAGEDGEFYRAGASVDFDGKTVILNCPKVEFPVKVRYAYFSYGATPLYADNGLAATPFSVDVEKTLGGM